MNTYQSCEIKHGSIILKYEDTIDSIREVFLNFAKIGKLEEHPNHDWVFIPDEFIFITEDMAQNIWLMIHYINQLEALICGPVI